MQYPSIRRSVADAHNPRRASNLTRIGGAPTTSTPQEETPNIRASGGRYVHMTCDTVLPLNITMQSGDKTSCPTCSNRLIFPAQLIS